jgi:hypothetical protein
VPELAFVPVRARQRDIMVVVAREFSIRKGFLDASKNLLKLQPSFGMKKP